MRHPEPSTILCSFSMLQMRGEGSAPLLFRAADPPSSLDSPTVQRSRSFGFAETVSKHFAIRVARLRMARRGGSEMDHEPRRVQWIQQLRKRPRLERLLRCRYRG